MERTHNKNDLCTALLLFTSHAYHCNSDGAAATINACQNPQPLPGVGLSLSFGAAL